MSYIRSGEPFKFVESESRDYVFPSDKQIEDHGKITDQGLVELFYRYWKTDDTSFKNHLLKCLAKKLNVKLREKPLSEEEYVELYFKK
ncbi:MAG: hypothetical protein KAT77_03895 [Nanoarchaeota archaeon]|nr:hypothetical protein [Nanoarchaeota archaeon]